jgi:hypothetical protein
LALPFNSQVELAPVRQFISNMIIIDQLADRRDKMMRLQQADRGKQKAPDGRRQQASRTKKSVRLRGKTTRLTRSTVSYHAEEGSDDGTRDKESEQTGDASAKEPHQTPFPARIQRC